MKKRLLFLLVVVVLVVPVQGIFGQNGVDYSDQRTWPEEMTLAELAAERPSSNPNATNGLTTYYTHPEFGSVMTTTVTTPANGTADGLIFMAALAPYYDGRSAVMILDNEGEPVYIRPIPGDPFVGDVKVQSVNGTDYLTYHAGILPGGYTFGTNYVLDENYNLVDTWTYQNAKADLHEFLLLDNGHAILMAYEYIPWDLTPYGGPANGTLVDIVLQEQDANKNVVFEWRGTDHMPIEDTSYDLNSPDPIDFLHTNAIEIDLDGNWLLSHRNFSEITKINRQTGAIMWRLGGQGNEFTFTNDIGFAKQHDIRRLPNGNITIFDNGNDHATPHSRAIEYSIDEVNMTVTRVWAYPDDMSEYSFAMGNHQRLLSNGNSFIGWGTTPQISEVKPNGSLAFEMIFPSYNYRAYRLPWTAVPSEAPRVVATGNGNAMAVTLYTSWNGATDITAYDVYAGPTPGSLSLVDTVSRDGFETQIELTGLPADTCFFQTQPIDAQADPTPFSNIAFRLDLQVCWDQLEHSFMPIATK